MRIQNDEDDSQPHIFLSRSRVPGSAQKKFYSSFLIAYTTLIMPVVLNSWSLGVAGYVAPLLVAVSADYFFYLCLSI